ncbi:glutamine--fructose-6-phosphate transaminase (isomerizing) [Candidatus Woesearchaeota archaeon]|nr:glutamine--fructose-6-phosphate transaminase (isomerizing) [Candidatus Woesearchaeota archaeon]
MCGIVGYIGHRDAFPIIADALSRIEYRGYDSFGFATIDEGMLHIQKKVGAITECKIDFMPGHVGVGHTRWATHGGVEERNAHPHVSRSGRFCMVHNGIIENYLALQNELKQRGIELVSDTDTEVIVQLIDSEARDGTPFFEAAKNVIARLSGSFAFAVIDTQNPGAAVLASVEAPLRIGLLDRHDGGQDIFFASDPVAFLPYTKKAIFLQDGDVAFIEAPSIIVRNRQDWSAVMRRNPEEITWNRAEVSKEGFEHFMLKEIYEQKDLLKFPPPDEQVIATADAMRAAKNVWLLGCGTAYHAALAGSRMLLPKGINARACLASDFYQFHELLTDNDVLIAVSQSGETADLLSEVRFAKKQCPGLLTIAVTNAIGSTLVHESGLVLYTHCGVEVGVASTKAYTAQIGIFSLICGAIVSRARGVSEAKERISTDARAIEQFLGNVRNPLQRIAQKIKESSSIYVIGHGSAATTCLEGALKIKELSYIHAEGMNAAELKHGTLALIEKGVPCIVVVNSEDDLIRTVSSAMEIKARGGMIIGISGVFHPVFDDWIQTPASFYPEITMVVPLQLLAYELAVARGKNPDKPRNLAKSVTVH